VRIDGYGMCMRGLVHACVYAHNMFTDVAEVGHPSRGQIFSVFVRVCMCAFVACVCVVLGYKAKWKICAEWCLGVFDVMGRKIWETHQCKKTLVSHSTAFLHKCVFMSVYVHA